MTLHQHVARASDVASQTARALARTWAAASSGARAVIRPVAAVPTAGWVTAAVIFAVPVLWIEVTGAIAGVLRHGRPVLVGPVEAWQTTVAILTDGIGRWAWPQDAQPGLGRWKQIRAVAWISGVLVACLVAYVWVLSRSMRVEGMREKYRERGARWAQARELRRLHVRGPRPGRVILGKRDGKLLASEDNASTLIIAPSQAGKTTGLAVPAMVEWQGPCLATSVKGDLLVDTIAARSLMGEVKVFDPTGSTSAAGSSWSPVAAATSWSAARRVAASILQIGMRQHGGQDDSFWRQAGAAYLAPLLLAGNYLEVTTATVLRWATSTDEEAVGEATTALKAMVTAKTLGASQALHDLQQMWGVDDRYRSSVIGTLSTHLDAWKEPALERATASDADGITPEWLLDGNNTLFLSAPAAEQRRLRGLFVALVIEVVAAAFARAAKTGRPLDPRLLMMMDEAANIAPLPNIDEIASTGPGQGVLLCTILQNLSQAEETWGKDRADTILANHRARLFGAGIGDASTLEYIGRILGDEVRESTSINRKRYNPIDLGSRSESLEYRSLLGSHEIRQLGEGQVLLVYGQLPPTRLALRPWFKDRRLRRLVKATPPRRAKTTEPPADAAPATKKVTTTKVTTTKPAAAPNVAAPKPAANAAATPAAEPQLSIFDQAPAASTPAAPASVSVSSAEPEARGRDRAGTAGAAQPGWYQTPDDPRGRLQRAMGGDVSQALADLRLACEIDAVVGGDVAQVLTGAAHRAGGYAGHLEVLAAGEDPHAALLGLGAAQDPDGDDGIAWWTGARGERLAVRLADGDVYARRLHVDGVGAVLVAAERPVAAGPADGEQ